MSTPPQSRTPPGNPQSKMSSSSSRTKEKFLFSFLPFKKVARTSNGGQDQMLKNGNAALALPDLISAPGAKMDALMLAPIPVSTPAPAPIPVPTPTLVFSPPLTDQPDAINLTIFLENIERTAEFLMPAISYPFSKTTQLVHCARLLCILESQPLSLSSSSSSSSLTSAATSSSKDVINGLALSKDEHRWIENIKDDLQEKRRIQQLVIAMVNEFILLPVKDCEAIHEIVLLAPVLEKDHYRKLINYFLGEFEQATMLDIDILQGIVQLVQDAPPLCLSADALTQILRSIRRRLEDPAQQDNHNTVHLTRAITTVLVIMADCGVHDLNRKQEHEPLVTILSRLQKDKDSLLKFQAEYAFQASLLVPDDETALMELRRHAFSLTTGLLTMSGVIKLDFKGISKGLPNAIEGARGVFDLLKEAIGPGERRPWYQAVRKAENYIREGRLIDLNKWIYEAPCCHDPMFQWGICQLLGEIAVEPFLDETTREGALKFLDQMYAISTHRDVRNWILTILGYISELNVADPTYAAVDESIRYKASSLIQRLQTKDGDKALSFLDRLGRRLPLPCSSSLLQKVNKTINLEPRLHEMQIEKKGQEPLIYIQLLSKANLQASSMDNLELLDEKVTKFLASQREVLLILGDSGAGKSTFNLHLESKLWSEYQPGNPIPLFIDLKAMGKLDEVDLIKKKLEIHDFEVLEIRELKKNRQVVLICDGYDECRQWINLHRRLKVDLGWRSLKIVITCRTQYLPPIDYRMYFDPQPEDNQAALQTFKLYEEVVIVPFRVDQITACIQQFRDTSTAINVFEDQPIWSTEYYLKQLANLMDLVKNPFMLRIALLTLPTMAKGGRDLSKIQLTRFELYDEFMRQNFDNELKRLCRHRLKMDPEESRAFELVQVNFHIRCMSFSKRVAHSIFMQNDGVNAVEYSTSGEEQGWKDKFFGLEVDAKVKLLRQSSQLVSYAINTSRQSSTSASIRTMYLFPHRSILEFLYSCRLCDHTPNSIDLDRYFENARYNDLSTCLTTTTSPSLLTDHPFNQRSIVSEPSIIHFLVEHVQQRDEFKGQLHDIIELSKTDSHVSQAAANAITILVRAGIRFNEANLNGIRIPGADLSYGQFDSAQLQGADLRDTILRNIWLRQANLSNARMEGVQFGEQPYLTEESSIYSCAFSPDGMVYVIGLEDGAIGVYDTLTWSKTHTLRGHQSSVRCVVYSPNGQQIASGSDDQTVQLWNVQTGEHGPLLNGHTGAVTGVVYSPSGQQIASGSDDQTVRLWDVQTGAPGPILSGHTKEVTSVVYSPNGQQIASGSEDGTVRLWNAQTGAPGPVLSSRILPVTSVVYSPNGQQIASGSNDDTVRLWDARTGAPGSILSGHTDCITSVVYSPNGQQIASGSRDRTVRLWDAQTVAPGPILSGHTDEVTSVVYSPNGQQIASCSDDNTVRLWNAQTGAPCHILSGHTEEVTSVVYSPNGQQIASCSYDATGRLWNTQTDALGPILNGHTEKVTSVAYSPNGQQIASCSNDMTVRLWDAQTGALGLILSGHTNGVKSVVYSPNGQQIASCSNDKTVRLWNAQTGEPGLILSSHNYAVQSLKYSPDGQQIASCSSDKTVRLWNAQTGEPGPILTGHAEEIRSLMYSPNGQQITSGSFDETARLLGARFGEPSLLLTSHTHAVMSVVYSPDSQQIASGCSDKTVRLWDAQTGTPGPILNGHTDWVTSVVYSPNGQQIASGSKDKMARLWDAQSGEPGPILTGHTHGVKSVAYSPNGWQIASSSDDTTVRLWDAQTGEPGPILTGHTNGVNSVAYSPNGWQIASGSDDETVRLWDVNSGQCLAVVSDFHAFITNIIWNATLNSTYFATGCADKSVRIWRVVEEEGHYNVRLQWSAMHDRLAVSNTSVRGVQDLSKINMRLLEQRGAVLEHTPARKKQKIAMMKRMIAKGKRLKAVTAEQERLIAVTGEQVRAMAAELERVTVEQERLMADAERARAEQERLIADVERARAEQERLMADVEMSKALVADGPTMPT